METQKFLVSGLLNIEVSCPVTGFPLEYVPVRFEFNSVAMQPSGVGLNLAAALKLLGNEVTLAGLIGDDTASELVTSDLRARGLGTELVRRGLSSTPRSVVLFDPSGRRSCITDLSNLQSSHYPEDLLRAAITDCDWALLCNLEYNRVALSWAVDANRPIATDVHALSTFDDPYNGDFMAAATVLFCSHEYLPDSPEASARELIRRYSPQVLVIGMGADGALLATDEHDMVRFPAQHSRAVVNTVGAGDALASSFLHNYARTGNPAEALRRATWFASWKIGASSASDGFPSPAQWAELHG